MNPSDVQLNWLELNQKSLQIHFRRINRILEKLLNIQSDEDENEGPIENVNLEDGDSVQFLMNSFSLSDFERDILLLCAGAELDFGIMQKLEKLQQGKFLLNIKLILSVLPEPHWSALTSKGALRRWHLIELGNGEMFTLRPVKITERILHFLTGLEVEDELFNGLFTIPNIPESLYSSHRQLSEKIVDRLRTSDSLDNNSVINLFGPDGSARQQVSTWIADQLSLKAYIINGSELPVEPLERERFARLWEREAILNQGALIIELEDEISTVGKAVNSFLKELNIGLCFISSRESINILGVKSFELKYVTPQEQYNLWMELFEKDNGGKISKDLKLEIEKISSHFKLDYQTILEAGALFDNSENREVAEKELWQYCRLKARTSMEDLAERIKSKNRWENLILPEVQMDCLHHITQHVKHRLKVYEEWGFAHRSARGLGISALFSGPSGTGKTLAAEVIANELEMDLYRIDLGAVVSKYIGETEKNLRRIFDAAEVGGCVLLFDEADALFGKRSEVKDSHDRHANIEVSYLLQRMENYQGLTILTTNFKNALDSAFLRRIRFVANFPFPDHEGRKRIWENVFPKVMPLDNLDHNLLAKMNVTGGNIHSIALNAAFTAAQENSFVNMEHIYKGARNVYHKLEKSVSKAEFGEYI